MPTRADTAVELGNDQPSPTQRLTLAIRLADGGAEQAPDAVGESQAERSAGDEPQDSSADAASAQAGCSTSCLAQLRRDAAVPDDDSRRAGQSREPAPEQLLVLAAAAQVCRQGVVEPSRLR